MTDNAEKIHKDANKKTNAYMMTLGIKLAALGDDEEAMRNLLASEAAMLLKNYIHIALMTNNPQEALDLTIKLLNVVKDTHAENTTSKGE